MEKNSHPQSCTAGGDAVALHYALRRLVHAHCARAQLRPQAEAPGFLNGWSLPADIVVRGASAMLAPCDGFGWLSSTLWAQDIGTTVKGPHEVVCGTWTQPVNGFRWAVTTHDVQGDAVARVYARLDEMAVVCDRGAGRVLRCRRKARGFAPAGFG